MLTDTTIRNTAQKNNEPAWLLNIRLDALKKLSETNIQATRGLITPTFSENTLFPAEKDETLITTPENIILFTNQAARQQDAQQHFNSLTSHDKWSAIHNASFANLAYFSIPQDHTPEQPITFALDATKNQANTILITAEKGSSATIIEYSTSKKPIFHSSAVSIIAKENARLIENAKDPHTHKTRNLGYVYGDRLRSEFHPLISPQ